MEKDPKKKELTSEQAKTVAGFVKNIQEEHKKLQKYLEEVGISPVGGWKSPEEYRLVSGLNLVTADGDCDECSIVDFPDDCVTECCDTCGSEDIDFDIMSDKIRIRTINPSEAYVQKTTKITNKVGLVLKRRI